MGKTNEVEEVQIEPCQQNQISRTISHEYRRLAIEMWKLKRCHLLQLHRNTQSDSGQPNAQIDEISAYVSARWISPPEDGPGGTGKTFLYRALLAYVRAQGHIALAMATSGIAASILPGGRTAHSRFKIPIDSSEGTSCKNHHYASKDKEDIAASTFQTDVQ